MAKWKITRQTYGKEEFKFSEGEKVSIGRGKNNSIVLASIVISRNHCTLDVKNNEVFVTDLTSSNGVYVDGKKISQNTPHSLTNSDIIGLGWSAGPQLVDIDDKEKFVFRLVKENGEIPCNTITSCSTQKHQNIEEQIAALNGTNDIRGPYINSAKPSLKRKINNEINILNIKKEIKEEKVCCPFVTVDEDVIALSESDSEIAFKVSRLEPVTDNNQNVKSDQVKSENEFLEFEAFNVKQEYLGYDDEPIQIDSDSDSESEQWYLRLSQSSPGKPFIKMKNKIDSCQENSSYSQLDDFVDSNGLVDDDEEFIDDIIVIPEQPPDYICKVQQSDCINLAEKEKDTTEGMKNIDEKVKLDTQSKQKSVNEISNDQVSSSDDIPIIKSNILAIPTKCFENISKDLVDGLANCIPNHANESVSTSGLAVLESPGTNNKKTQMIDPLIKLPRRKSQYVIESIDKMKFKAVSSKQEKTKRYSTDRQKLTSTQKEERKKKLKEIASKGKKDFEPQTNNNLESSSNKLKANVKITSTNRGAFLSSTANLLPKDKDSNIHTSPDTGINEDSQNKRKAIVKPKKKYYNKSSIHKDKDDQNKSKSHDTGTITLESTDPLKGLKPLESDKLNGTEVSHNSLTVKQKKKVRFSEIGPQVHVFEIEPGNRMKKTSLVKSTLENIRQSAVYSLEKITLMKILCWNPHWLDEQVNNNDPPPILGHNHPPMSIFHSFVNHSQYVQLIGDLLLMEIWECLTVAHMKLRNENNYLQMRIGSLSPVPSQDRYFELFNLSVEVSLPSSESKRVPRVGEIILVHLEPENAKTQRFFYVHGVRSVKSPQNNKNTNYYISLYATFTEKMKWLRPGEVIFGKNLAYISKELMLFEAMEYLAGSPLSEAILKPEAQHFPTYEIDHTLNIKSQFTMTLNPSQQLAVRSSVSAALHDRPSIQMVQGPPGTGKSSVICAIVMTYFYDALGKRQQNRGKILICATSNAAVDELVIRLLKIRQRLPKCERFRMVRVGRAEAMHPRAHEVSSQQLAQRDLAAARQPHPHPHPHTHPHPHAHAHAHAGIAEEIFHLEAKINMWKTAVEEAKDPVRVAYCQSRISELVKRITLVRSGQGGGGGEVRPEQLAQAERRIIEGADIVVTTLASAHNHKMRGLKRRIALCIVDEAGQAIEPETLIPLTLDVTRLTLIGDSQQLPGYICSQRAKKHGLSESLFSRLASCTEHWTKGSPVVLLNQQYRMHPDIADYPNRAFYDSRIQTVAQHRPDIMLPPYSIVSIHSGDKGQGVTGANATEAWGVARLAAALAARLPALSIAVITPYNAHKELIKKCLKALQQTGSAVEVNTVDSFQGQERDVVVASLARSQGVGFLTDAGRMNVMLTRARHALVVCLNPHATIKNQQWSTLVEDAQRRNVYRELPFRLCQPIQSGNMYDEDILKYVSNG